MKRWTLAAAVLVVAMVAALWAQGSDAICPHCTCPAMYDLVCARRKDNGAIRGFSSRCVLDCTNKCRPASKQFVFLKKEGVEI